MEFTRGRADTPLWPISGAAHSSLPPRGRPATRRAAGRTKGGNLFLVRAVPVSSMAPVSSLCCFYSSNYPHKELVLRPLPPTSRGNPITHKLRLIIWTYGLLCLSVSWWGRGGLTSRVSCVDTWTSCVSGGENCLFKNNSVICFYSLASESETRLIKQKNLTLTSRQPTVQEKFIYGKKNHHHNKCFSPIRIKVPFKNRWQHHLGETILLVLFVVLLVY